MYLWFASRADREVAMRRQPFFHEDARIDLHREEEFGRVPQRARFCVLLAASAFPMEFLNPVGIRAAFSGFGKLLEVDPRVIAGHELDMVRAVVLMEHPRDLPSDVWPWGGRWGARVISIEPLMFWDMAASFNDDGEYIPFFMEGPPPFAHNQPTLHGRPVQRSLGVGPVLAEHRHQGSGGGQLASLLRVLNAPLPTLAGARDHSWSPPTSVVISELDGGRVMMMMGEGRASSPPTPPTSSTVARASPSLNLPTS